MIYFLLAQVAQKPDLDNLSFDWAFVKMLGAMAVVIALAFVLLKYLLPRLTGHPSKKGSGIQITDYYPLGNRKSIYVVTIEDKKVAIGVTDHNITKITEWNNENVS